MKVFVTGVAGQLGHDVVNELTKRGHQAVGSDIAPALETTVKYVPLDITDATAVEQTIQTCSRMPSCTVRHGPLWMQQRTKKIRQKSKPSM